MSQVLEFEPKTALGKGSCIRYFVDKSKADDEIGYFFTEVQYDGFPDSVPFEVPMHWHENHDEWIEVLEGELDITIEQNRVRVRAGDDPKHIPRGRMHALKSIKGVAVRIRERTDPVGRFKEEFFRDAFKYGISPSFLYLMRACWDGDAYIAFLPKVPMLNSVLNFLLGGLAKLVMPARHGEMAD